MDVSVGGDVAVAVAVVVAVGSAVEFALTFVGTQPERAIIVIALRKKIVFNLINYLCFVTVWKKDRLGFTQRHEVSKKNLKNLCLSVFA